MKSSRIELPAGQNWNCRGCTECCRHSPFVILSEADRNRLQQQGWTKADGVDPEHLIEAGVEHYRLALKPDGSCVFLDERGLCRIHARFGEAAKPLPCRVYPLLLYPAGKQILVGLKFSCPTAGANDGEPMTALAHQIPKLARLVLPEAHEKIPPPPVAAQAGLEWPDFRRYVLTLDRFFVAEKVPVALKLQRAMFWLASLERGCLDQAAGEGAEEILQALADDAVERWAALPEKREQPSGFGRLFLRLLVLEHARHTTVADQSLQSLHRWKMLLAAVRFVRSTGHTPDLREGLKSVPFRSIETRFGPLPAGAEALLTRYFRVKIQSQQFCGVGFHDCSLVEGFRNLALMYPIIIWLARWLAVSAGRSQLTDVDVARAITIADFQYSFTPYLAWRTRLMQQRNDIERLCGWYAD
jgi:lysine-N-methylase